MLAKLWSVIPSGPVAPIGPATIENTPGMRV